MCVTAATRPVALSTTPGVARRQVAELLSGAGWAAEAVDDAVLAVHEALVNALRHGGGVRRAAAGFDEGSLVVKVWDQGSGFEMPGSIAMPDRLAERGRGLFLMRRLAGDVTVAHRGAETCLHLRFDP